MKAAFLFVALTAALAYASEPAPAAPRREPSFLLIPSSPPEQKLTEAMVTRLKQLKEEDWLSKLDTWSRLKELPMWASDKKEKLEIAYLGSVPATAVDAFRYAVIASGDGDVVIIRAGGFAGVYEIFQKKKPNQALEPTPVTVTPPAAQEPRRP